MKSEPNLLYLSITISHLFPNPYFLPLSSPLFPHLSTALASRRVLVYVWDTCLRLLHPFMPFLTEALWQQIPHRGDSVMMVDWPQREGG